MKLDTRGPVLQLGYTLLVLADIFADSLASLVSLMFTDTQTDARRDQSLILDLGVLVLINVMQLLKITA